MSSEVPSQPFSSLMTAPSGYEARFPELVRLAAHVALRIVRDHGDAEDIAVEALARAYQRWSRIEDYAAPWVVRTATNLAIDHVRRRRAPYAGEVTPTGVEDHVVGNEMVAELLRQLPRRQREALALTVLCGYSSSQVAEILGISTTSVKTHVQRGLSTLRRSRTINDQEAATWTIPT
jgi:RNA polymerase sigma-70 factor (ECF subfamily)